MSRLARLARLSLSTEAFDLRAGQLICFAAGPVVFVFAIHALRRHVTTTGELVVGLLAAVAVMLLFVVIGLILPLAERQTTGRLDDSGR